MSNFGVQTCLNFLSFASVDVCRKWFHSFPRNKVIELIHPHNVANFLFVGACTKNESLSPKCEQGGQLVEHVLDSIQCSNNSSLSWHSGNIGRKFPILSQAHNRPCFQAMTSCKKIHSFIPMVKGFMPRQRPFPLSSDHVFFSHFHSRFIYTMFLRFTSCPLNGPPLGIPEQNWRKKIGTTTIGSSTLLIGMGSS